MKDYLIRFRHKRRKYDFNPTEIYMLNRQKYYNEANMKNIVFKQ